MWSDNETNLDFLNFQYVADIAAEMIAQAEGRPLSMGISGSWGVGKSSMMKLLAQSMRKRENAEFLFVEFNAWLYQGYDDTRAALMEIIAQELVLHTESNEPLKAKIGDKAKRLLARVNWFRVAAVGITTAASLAAGLPPVGLIGEGVKAFKGLTDGNINQADIDAAQDTAKRAGGEAKGLIKDAIPLEKSPPKAIQEFRDELEATLNEMNVTLIVLIDDLDRCLPPTTIATLEAMRLFLFLKHTAFIIAADDKMIREAVRSHFKGMTLDDALVTNYFDKLIQVPIRVPPLGTQDVRAYLMLLFIENSKLDKLQQEHLRASVCKQLGQTWTGKRVDRAFVMSLIQDCPPMLASDLDLADRIAPMMTTAENIKGNPRLIKRFLNTLSIRKSIARSQGVNIDESALAKMLLFERCGNEKAYAELLSSINESNDGLPSFLAPLEAQAARDPAKIPLQGEWDNKFVREWLALQPALASLDLRGVVYVSREHLPIITAADLLSTKGAELLDALLGSSLTSTSKPLADELAKLPQREVSLILDRILIQARQINAWGVPPILNSALTVASVDIEHAEKLGRFLLEIPLSQLTPSIIPLLADKGWASDLLKYWSNKNDLPATVKRAITNVERKK